MFRLALTFLLLHFYGCSSINTNQPQKRVDGKRQLANNKRIFHKESGYLYDPNDTSCDGFPKVDVETMPGTCLGMVISREYATDKATDRDFIKPRTIVQIPGTEEFLVMDMGGWKRKNGRLFWLKRKRPNRKVQVGKYQKNPYEIKILRYGMDTPHGLRFLDGYYYMGERDKISRFKFNGKEITNFQVVIQGLPAFGSHMHPLTEFNFDPVSKDIFINSGAPSDHCFLEGSGDYKQCPESEKDGMGAIYRVPYALFSNGQIVDGVKEEWLVAKGLRNSMAMAIHPSGFLIQGENGRDFAELEEPYEEINVINLNRTKGDQGDVYHYGWPYCFNFRATSPEWDFEGPNNYGIVKERYSKPIDCRNSLVQDDNFYMGPHALMPPHVAPLHAGFYTNENVNSEKGFSELKDHLIFTWHGHEPTGNRLVAYPHDDQGLPLLETHGEHFYHVDQGGGACPTKHLFSPRGGLLRYAPYKEIISGWSKIDGVRPEGNPVAFTVADDGSIWIVEDKNNRSVLRLAKGESFVDNCTVSDGAYEDPKIKLLAWRDYINNNEELKNSYLEIKDKLISNSCLGCHGDLKVNDIDNSNYNTLDFLSKNEWIVPGKPEESKLFGAVAHLPAFTPMPPADKKPLLGTNEGEEIIEILRQWIDQMNEGNPSKNFKKVRVIANGKRNFRNSPTTSGSTVCGVMEEGDVMYMDLRKDSIIYNGGYPWAKLYLVPNHTRINKGKCAHPLDGVYYVAIGKGSEFKGVVSAFK